jgi:hypothetical protein
VRYLHYTNYHSGHSGLSNGIMSIEVGAVLAFLTNRFLVLDGNVSPPANVVSYGDRVDNSRPSRVTDLIDVPVAWGEPGDVELTGLRARELSDVNLGRAAFYVPGTVDLWSADAEAFANGRKHWLSGSDELEEVPLLRVSEEHDRKDPRYNLTFYSYFFYLDDDTRRSVYRMLQRMQAKAELVELARRVAADLGSFNAVHLRRGDFKVTYGVTTLDRQPWEAIEVLDQHFRRQDTLVIVTDERDDPFFTEIKAAYPHHVFIDHHVLDEYGRDFDALPHHDSIALAYLSQLIAAESDDFIGTMTSTFTAIIQRYRGNRGKDEPFKFLWNELPDPEDRIERGRHPVSECIPLDRGVMVEEASGPYSWNRYNPRIAANWMREWPESFLTPEVLETGKRNGGAKTATSPILQIRSQPSHVDIRFEDLSIKLRSSVPRMTARLGECFGSRRDAAVENVIGELEVAEHEGRYRLSKEGEELANAESFEDFARAIKQAVAPLFVHARRRHIWLEGTSFRRAGRAVLLVGDLGTGSDWLPDAMCSNGWELLWDDVVPVRVEDCSVTPFGRSSWPKGAALRIDRTPCFLSGLIVTQYRLHQRDSLVPLSPAVGVAELIGKCIDFRFDRQRAVERLCRLVEKRRVGLLTFSSAERAVDVITRPFLAAEREANEQKETA